MMNREHRGRLYNVVRPFENCSSTRESRNMFCETGQEKGKREVEELDRFVAGAKIVRIYKNSIKRKKKLTHGIIDSTYSKWSQSCAMTELMSSQEVIHCLPKINFNKKIKEENKYVAFKTCHQKYEKEWLHSRRVYNSESSLLRSVDEYRQLIEAREKSIGVVELPNVRSQEWTQNLRQKRKEKKCEHIQMKGKMVMCGLSKKKTEKEWLMNKENQGYGFELLPQVFMPKKGNALGCKQK